MQKIDEVKEAKLRKTARSTLTLVMFFCVIFLVRAIQWELYGRVLSLSLCMLLAAISFLLLNNGKSRTYAAIFGVMGCCIAAGYASYSSGGLRNPAMGWLIILPLIGALIGGKNGVIFAFLFSFFTGLFLFFLEYGISPPPNLTPIVFQQSQDRLHQLGQLTIVTLSIICLFRQIHFSEVQLSETVIQLSEEVQARALAEQKSDQASKVKSEFLANMSHEIRTPMNGIVGMLNILKKENLNKVQSKYLDLAKSSSETMMVVINDILDLSKIESGKLELEKTGFDLTKLIKDIEQVASLNASEKGLYFNCHTDLCSDTVMGDPVRIRQVIDNLINNAIKFTEKGEVSLSVSLTQNNTSLCLLTCEVSDTGIGIPQEKLECLFTPFQQVEASTTRRFGGTGLGLSISKQLIDIMNGSMEVSSEEGKGSRFYFSINLDASDPSELPKEDRYVIEKKQSTDKDQFLPVLLVEDNEINILVALSILESFPICVDVAKNGKQAIEMIDYKHQSENDDYRVVFMDCQMPEMDGYEASKFLRQQQEYKDLPIIAMTANAMKGDKEKCLTAGMSDYMTKPIDHETIEKKLFQWLNING